MSTTAIKLKKSSVIGKAPVTGDIEYGEVALNYADGRLFYKNSSNVIKNFVDSDLITTRIASAVARSFATFEYLADSGQTTFLNSDENGSILSYNPNNIIVSLNGIILRPGDDYIASNGTSIALDSAVSLNDVLQITSFDFFNIADTVRASTGGTFSGPITATAFVGPLTGAVTGNASTATTLQTARTIAISGDVTGTATSFNGSTNITISSSITADTIVNADINSAAAIVDTKLATISTAGKVSNSATTATSANTASAIVARDASGNFTAGTITATSFTGSASGLTGITSSNLSSPQQLIIYNSAGSAVKTLYGTGS